MQRTDNRQTGTAHRRVQHSTTLNRKYVRRPVKNTDVTVTVKRSPKVSHFASASPARKVVRPAETNQPIAPAKAHPLQVSANNQMRARYANTLQKRTPAVSAKELKDQAIRKALASASVAPVASEQPKQQKVQKKIKKGSKPHFGFGRIVLALSCAAVAVCAIVYFVNLNMPDISLKVAAMQSGIEASYPGYIPRGFNASGVTSEKGKIVLNFTNPNTGDAFVLSEEKSYWDSNALVSNYVKDAFGEDYTTVREQGITIYIKGSDATWVNGGITYKLKTTAGELSGKQIRSIAVSL